MKEDEYINATNLAKLRIAKTILRDCLFFDEDEKAAEISIQWISTLIEKLEKSVSAEEG